MGVVVFNISKTLPKDTRLDGVRDQQQCFPAGQSNPKWEIPKAEEPDFEEEQVFRSPPAKKRKTPASTSPAKKKVAPKISLRTLMD